MSTRAIALAVVATVLWGGWALLADAAADELSPITIMLAVGVMNVVIAAGTLLFTEGEILGSFSGVSTTALVVAGVAGVASAGATVTFYTALSISGSATTPTTITGLYFAVTAIIEWMFLGGSLEIRQVAGVALAVVAIFLLVGGG